MFEGNFYMYIVGIGEYWKVWELSKGSAVSNKISIALNT